MNRLLSQLILPFVATSALAQATTEAPVERVGGTTVLIFVVLFIGMCVGIVWLSVLSGRKEKREQEASGKRITGV